MLKLCDVQDYIQGFTGYVKAKRLLFIAEQCSGSEFALDALRMAHDELKEHVRGHVCVERDCVCGNVPNPVVVLFVDFGY